MEQLNHIWSFYAHSSKRFKFQIYWQTVDTPFLTARKAQALCPVHPMMKVVLCVARGLNEGATFKLWNNPKPSIFPLFVPQKSIFTHYATICWVWSRETGDHIEARPCLSSEKYCSGREFASYLFLKIFITFFAQIL